MRKRKPKLIELDAVELRAIVDLTKASALDAKDHEKLKATIETCLWMMAELLVIVSSVGRQRRGAATFAIWPTTPAF